MRMDAKKGMYVSKELLEMIIHSAQDTAQCNVMMKPSTYVLPLQKMDALKHQPVKQRKLITMEIIAMNNTVNWFVKSHTNSVLEIK